jgi:hypothetical protein
VKGCGSLRDTLADNFLLTFPEPHL